jgi:hypothetical protein
MAVTCITIVVALLALTGSTLIAPSVLRAQPAAKARGEWPRGHPTIPQSVVLRADHLVQ